VINIFLLQIGDKKNKILRKILGNTPGFCKGLLPYYHSPNNNERMSRTHNVTPEIIEI